MLGQNIQRPGLLISGHNSPAPKSLLDSQEACSKYLNDLKQSHRHPDQTVASCNVDYAKGLRREQAALIAKES